MNKKVLGFKKKDIDEIRDVWEVPFNAYDKVPVITVKWLAKWIDDHENLGDLNALHLLKAVRLQVKK